MTNNFDIKILHNNFNILRKKKHLSKGEFNKLIGISNVFRTNYFSIGAKLLKGIQDHFPGIDEEWLLTSHDVNYEFPEVSTNNIKVCEEINNYDIRAGTDLSPSELGDLMKLTSEVLLSNTKYGKALKENIEAFHMAVNNHKPDPEIVNSKKTNDPQSMAGGSQAAIKKAVQK